MLENKIFNVAVLGCGNGGLATASHLSSQGHRVSLFQLPERAESILPIQKLGGIELISRNIPEISSGFVPLEIISTDPEAVITSAEIIFLIVPAFAQEKFVGFCARYFRPSQILILAPGNFGALHLQKNLAQIIEHPPILVEMETMIYFAIKETPTKVVVEGYKHNVKVATLKETQVSEILVSIRHIYPTIQPATSVLETGLGNINTVSHVPILLLNSGRAESHQDYIFYHEGCTQSVGKILEELDQERINVAGALGLNLLSTKDVLINYYSHQGAKGESLSEVIMTNPAYAKRLGPKTLNHRFITEEVPYSMVLLEELGQLIRVPTPVNSSLITLSSVALGEDFRKNARGLNSLGLDGMSVKSLKQLVNHPT